MLARGASGHSAITIYLLDTHAYSPDEHRFAGYDWIKPSQIDWFKSTAESLKRKHKEYTHVHLDVAFIHIPLPEYRDANLTHIGDWLEPPTAPMYDSGFRDALVDEGVVMVSCGQYVSTFRSSSPHALTDGFNSFPPPCSDHVNEYCGLSYDEQEKPALWMCYGGGTGFGGYGGYGGYVRKIRLFDFDMSEGRLTTWKRVEWGPDDEMDKRLDEQIIVDSGRPVAPMKG